MPADELDVVTYEVVHRSERGARTGACPQGWYAVDRRRGTVDVLDPNGTVVDAWSVPARAIPDAADGHLAVDVGRRTVVVTRPDRTVVVDETGRTVEVAHPRWKRNGGAAVVDPVPSGDARLWVVAASEATGMLSPQPRSGILRLVDLTTGTVVDEVDLADGHPEGYTLAAVGDAGVVLNGAYGQDGSTTWFLRVGGDRIDRRELGGDGIVAAVEHGRGEILVMPHDDDELSVRTWWDGAAVAIVDGTRLLAGVGDEEQEEEDGLGYEGAFVGPDHLAVTTWSDRVLVLRRDGTAVGFLDEDGDAEPGELLSVGSGRLLLRGRDRATLIALDL